MMRSIVHSVVDRHPYVVLRCLTDASHLVCRSSHRYPLHEHSSPIIRNALLRMPTSCLLVHERYFLATFAMPRTYQELARKLDCTRDEVISLFKGITLVNGNDKISETSDRSTMALEYLGKKVDFLRASGLTPQLLFKNAWLLTLPSHIIEPKIAYLRLIGINPLTIGLLKIQLEKLQRVVKRYSANTAVIEERLRYLARNFECSSDEIAKIVDVHTFLLIVEETKLKNITQILLDGGIERSAIKRDLWVFHFNEEKMRRRGQLARQVGLYPMKSWMFRCTEDLFLKVFNQSREAREVLGEHRDIIEYLAARLGCGMDYVQYVVYRNQQLPFMHPLKLKRMLDFIFEIGFTSSHICLYPGIMNYNVDVLRQRHGELKELGYAPATLRMLCCNQTAHEKRLARLKRGNASAKLLLQSKEREVVEETAATRRSIN